MSLTITILGCGSSSGVPRVGQGWGDCDPANPRNRRRRCSILVERHGAQGTTTVLVDTSPDLREQLLDANVTHIDGVLFTHSHADHTHGIDDLRPLFLMHGMRIEAFADDATLQALKDRFGYCFETPAGSSYPPILNAHTFDESSEIVIEGAGGTITAYPFLQHHGDVDSFGFRFDNVAYSSDVNGLPERALAQLTGLDVWIVDALRYRPHPSHFCLQDALSHIDRCKPRHSILTNLHTDMDYEALKRRLPDGIEPAFDGMTIHAR